MADVTAHPGRETPRGKLRDWIENRIKGVDTFDMVQIQEEAAAHFFKDPTWVKSMFTAMLGNEIRTIVGTMRERLRIGDQVVTRERGRVPRGPGAALTRKWNGWFEHTQEDGYIRLMAMTRPQLLAAAEEREQRGAIEVRTAKVWRAIAAQLQSDEQKVREHFRVDQLEALEHDILTEG